MGSVGVVVDAPVLDEHLSLGERLEELPREQLVADPRAEGLDVGVLPRRSWLDVARSGAREATPVAQGVGRQLGAVVAADVLGGRAAGRDQPVEDGDRRV